MPTNFHHDAAPPPSRCSIALHGEEKKQQPTLPYFLQGSIYRLSPIAYNLVVGKKKPYTCTATAFLYAIDFKSMPLSTQNSHGYECKPWGSGHANRMLCSAKYGIYILASSYASYIHKGRNLRLRPLCGIVYSQLLFFFYYGF